MVNLTINGKAVSVKEGTTILEAAKTIGETIPTLCYLKEVNAIGACRVCVVEVEGTDRCVTACNNFVEEGMVVYTNSRKVRTTRKTNVKLILSQHDYKCGTCIRSGNCALQSIANELNISEMPYDSILEKDNWDKTFPLIRDAQKCIKCMRCVQVCDNIQGMHIWDVVNTGSRTTVNVRANRNIAETACTLCGQCVSNCPVGALTERDDVGIVLDAIENEDIITVVQIAPAVRTAWGEDFGMSKEYATAQRLVAGLRRIGFDYIFDTTFAADMTIMEEGSEFLERLPEIKESGLPMFTSCKDLCFCFVNPVFEFVKKQTGKDVFYIAIDETILPSQKMLEELSALEELVMVGYPIGLWDKNNNFPIFRKGYTASHPAIDFNESGIGLVDMACFPGSSGSPIYILNEGGYKDKVGNLNWGQSRIIFIGTLFSGPIYDATGKLVVTDIPTSNQVVESHTGIMVNLGYYIKSSEILEFKNIIKEILEQGEQIS